MTEWAVKRFYKSAEFAGGPGRYVVTLDGREAKTPAGEELWVPVRDLAEAIAAEWEAQDEIIDPGTMPMMRLAATAIDRIGPRRAEVVDIMMQFGETDLLCYRAESPADLAERQAAVWQPLLDWAAEAHGAEMTVTVGIVPVPQPAPALDALRGPVEAFDDAALTAASAAAAATGSLIVALALAAGQIGTAEAVEAAFLDEDFRMERWGEDEEEMERRERICAEIEAAARFLKLCTAA